MHHSILTSSDKPVQISTKGLCESEFNYVIVVLVSFILSNSLSGLDVEQCYSTIETAEQPDIRGLGEFTLG